MDGYRGVREEVEVKDLGLYESGIGDIGESRGRMCDFQCWRK